MTLIVVVSPLPLGVGAISEAFRACSTVRPMVASLVLETETPFCPYLPAGELLHGRVPVDPDQAPVRVSGWRSGLLDLHGSRVAAGWATLAGNGRGETGTQWHRELSQGPLRKPAS
jgi:hypothetical protein